MTETHDALAVVGPVVMSFRCPSGVASAAAAVVSPGLTFATLALRFSSCCTTTSVTFLSRA